MPTLAEKITAPDASPKVIEACVKLIDEEVAGKGGLSGAAVKAGYKVIKALKPGMIKDVIENLMPDFARALEPIYVEAGGDSGKFTAKLQSNPDRAADLMLGVTDERASRAKNKTIKKTYERMRGGAKKHVVEAVPNLAKTLAPFC